MKYQSAILFASAAVPAVLAQTWTACNPLEKTCPCNPALGTTYSFDFTKGKASDVFPVEYNFKVEYKDDGIHLPVSKKGDAPTIASTKYIFGGKLDAVMKIAPGHGIVSSLVFQSADLDEIDWEWIGSKPLEAQSNYFGKGNTETYNRGQTHAVSDAAQNFHKYSIEWTKDKITWYLDDKPLRTLTPAQSADLYGSNNYYPQTPMQIKIGAWAAGDPSNQPGVIEWSDGPIKYGDGPFVMVIKSITVTDYSEGATEYCYGDRSGSWDSIEISNDPSKGKVSSSKPPTSTTKAAKPTTLSTSTKEEKTSSTSSKAKSSSAPASTTSRRVTSTMDTESAITQGVPDSIGGMNGPQNKGVSSESETATATATNDAAQSTNSNVPAAAASVRATSFGFLAAFLAAALIL